MSIQIETYYNRLNDATRLDIDASANGVLLAKPYAEAFDIFEWISSNDHQWSNPRAIQGKETKGIHDVDAFSLN